MNGIEQLNQCVALVLSKLEGIEKRVTVDETRPLTAEELCERWHVDAETEALQLHSLARLCRRWHLRPMSGTRGWDALYRRADVLRAETFAAGGTRK